MFQLLFTGHQSTLNLHTRKTSELDRLATHDLPSAIHMITYLNLSAFTFKLIKVSFLLLLVNILARISQSCQVKLMIIT